ncbi:hypothetical protein KEM54_006916, partial [Ascosphaera aggregata]
TFYINLDLTTYNGPLRASRKRAADTGLENPRTTAAAAPTSVTRSDDAHPRTSQHAGEDVEGFRNDDDVDNEQERINGDDEAATGDTSEKERGHHGINEDDGEGDDDEDGGGREQIQIMELHSSNPIVSYRNQIFSCEWADLIGTELAFLKPEGYTSELDRLRQTDKYDLLSASGVKLLGRKASLISTTHSRPRTTPTTTTTMGMSAADMAIKKKPLSNQARFFERLREIKRAKGENDTIRTSIPQRRFSSLYNLSLAAEGDTTQQPPRQQHEEEEEQAAPTTAGRKEQTLTASGIAAATSRQEKLKAWARTGQQLAEVEDLKRRALKGDEEAVTALENIMARTVEKAAAEARNGNGSSQGDASAAVALLYLSVKWQDGRAVKCSQGYQGIRGGDSQSHSDCDCLDGEEMTENSSQAGPRSRVGLSQNDSHELVSAQLNPAQRKWNGKVLVSVLGTL